MKKLCNMLKLYKNHIIQYFESWLPFSKLSWLGSGSAIIQCFSSETKNEIAGYGEERTRLILGLRPANERRRYFVTTSVIGWAQASGLSSSEDTFLRPCVPFGYQRVKHRLLVATNKCVLQKKFYSCTLLAINYPV